MSSRRELENFLRNLSADRVRLYNIRNKTGQPIRRKIGKALVQNISNEEARRVYKLAKNNKKGPNILAPVRGAAVTAAKGVASLFPTARIGLRGYEAFSREGAPAAARAVWQSLTPNQRRNIVNTAVNRARRNIFKTNLALNSIANAVINYGNNPTPNRAQRIKNNGMKFVSNYLSSQIGFKNQANVNKVYSLIQKLILISGIAARGTPSTQREYGEEIGRLLGELVFAYSSLEGGRGTYSNISNGLKKGVLDTLIGESMSAAIRRFIIAKGRYPKTWEIISMLGTGAGRVGQEVMTAQKRAANIEFLLKPTPTGAASRLAGTAIPYLTRRIAPLPEERRNRPENLYVY